MASYFVGERLVLLVVFLVTFCCGQLINIRSYNVEGLTLARFGSFSANLRKTMRKVIEDSDIIHLEEVKQETVINQLQPANFEHKNQLVGQQFVDYSSFLWNKRTVTLLSECVSKHSNSRCPTFYRAPHIATFSPVGEPKRSFTVVGVHLRRTGGPNVTKSNYAELDCLRVILDEVRQIHGNHHPIIVIGDFNYIPLYLNHNYAPLNDIKWLMSDKMGTQTRRPGGLTGYPLDRVFISNSLDTAFSKAAVPPRYLQHPQRREMATLSDHFPIELSIHKYKIPQAAAAVLPARPIYCQARTGPNVPVQRCQAVLAKYLRDEPPFNGNLPKQPGTK